MSTQNSICVICLTDKIQDVDTTSCNHKFCKECLTKWLKKYKTCPVCRKVISNNIQFNDEDEDEDIPLFQERLVCITDLLSIIANNLLN